MKLPLNVLDDTVGAFRARPMEAIAKHAIVKVVGLSRPHLRVAPVSNDELGATGKLFIAKHAADPARGHQTVVLVRVAIVEAVGAEDAEPYQPVYLGEDGAVTLTKPSKKGSRKIVVGMHLDGHFLLSV